MIGVLATVNVALTFFIYDFFTGHAAGAALEGGGWRPW